MTNIEEKDEYINVFGPLVNREGSNTLGFASQIYDNNWVEDSTELPFQEHINAKLKQDIVDETEARVDLQNEVEDPEKNIVCKSIIVSDGYNKDESTGAVEYGTGIAVSPDNTAESINYVGSAGGNEIAGVHSGMHWDTRDGGIHVWPSSGLNNGRALLAVGSSAESHGDHSAGIESNDSLSMAWADRGVFAATLTLGGENVATQAYVKANIDNLVNGAPEAYDTLKEIADYITEDTNAGAAILNEIADVKKKYVRKYIIDISDINIPSVLDNLSDYKSQYNAYALDVTSLNNSASIASILSNADYDDTLTLIYKYNGEISTAVASCRESSNDTNHWTVILSDGTNNQCTAEIDIQFDASAVQGITIYPEQAVFDSKSTGVTGYSTSNLAFKIDKSSRTDTTSYMYDAQVTDGFGNATTTSFDIPYASTEEAGLMKASDKVNLDKLVANSTSSSSTIDLSGYAKTDLSNVDTTAAETTLGYATKDDLTTVETSLDDYAKTDLSNVSSDTVASKIDLSGYVTSTDFDTAVNTTIPATYATKEELSQAQIDPSSVDLSGYVKTTDLAGYVKTTDLDSYATTTALSDYVQTANLDSAIASSDTVTSLQTEVDAIDVPATTIAVIKEFNECAAPLVGLSYAADSTTGTVTVSEQGTITAAPTLASATSGTTKYLTCPVKPTRTEFTISSATTAAAGLMSATDKTTLDSVSSKVSSLAASDITGVSYDFEDDTSLNSTDTLANNISTLASKIDTLEADTYNPKTYTTYPTGTTNQYYITTKSSTTTADITANDIQIGDRIQFSFATQADSSSENTYERWYMPVNALNRDTNAKIATAIVLMSDGSLSIKHLEIDTAGIATLTTKTIS